MKCTCKMCTWKGIAPIETVTLEGITMEIVRCPHCHADISCKTLNGGGLNDTNDRSSEATTDTSAK